MMIGKLAYAAGLLATSTAGGVALGGYTIGGFRIDQPTDTMSALVAERSAPGTPYGAGTTVLLTQGEPMHVCKGCDAKLYREWRYDPSDYAEPASYETYRGYKEQPAREDYPDDEAWDAAMSAYYHDDTHKAPDASVAAAPRGSEGEQEAGEAVSLARAY